MGNGDSSVFETTEEVGPEETGSIAHSTSWVGVGWAGLTCLNGSAQITGGVSTGAVSPERGHCLEETY